MTGVELYLAGKAVEGAAKGIAGTLVQHKLQNAANQKSPDVNLENCFRGPDGKRYCAVDEKLGSQNRVNRTSIREPDPLHRQPEIPPADFTEPAAKPWEEDSQTDSIEIDSFSDESTTFDDPTRFQSS
jgi:hypothetical protein